MDVWRSRRTWIRISSSTQSQQFLQNIWLFDCISHTFLFFITNWYFIILINTNIIINAFSAMQIHLWEISYSALRPVFFSIFLSDFAALELSASVHWTLFCPLCPCLMCTFCLVLKRVYSLPWCQLWFCFPMMICSNIYGDFLRNKDSPTWALTVKKNMRHVEYLEILSYLGSKERILVSAVIQLHWIDLGQIWSTAALDTRTGNTAHYIQWKFLNCWAG